MSDKFGAPEPKPTKIDYSRRSLLKVGTAFAGGLVAASLPEVHDVWTGKDDSKAEARFSANSLETQERNVLVAQQVNSQTLLNENPVEGGTQSTTATTRGGAKIHGTFSMQTFCDQGPLIYTHQDAGGWRAYLMEFYASNFWYQDSGVSAWAYYETFDNWQDTYGMDAVRAVYHSGHGVMNSDGVFYASLGSKWGGYGCAAVSSNMRLGNEYARYLFWSTCQSLRVSGRQNPIKTWHPTNLGWRMLFGYETNSIDSPNYGRFFWQEWNKNKSFSTAFLDASWSIYHNQSPSVVACGATEAEAQDRLYNERYLSANRSATDYYRWRWYTASTLSLSSPQLNLPQNLLVARLRPVAAEKQSVSTLASRFQLNISTNDVATAPDGSFRTAYRDTSIAYSADGSIDIQLIKPNLSNRKQILTQRAITLAQEAVQRYKLNQQVELLFDRVLLSCESGGTAKGSGELQETSVVSTTVQFRQVINRLPVITPGAGAVRISIDNDGRVTNVHSSVRIIEEMSSHSKITNNMPTPDGTANSLQFSEPANYEQLLASESNKILSSLTTNNENKGSLTFTTIPNSTELGYDIRGNQAVLIARKVIEVTFGNLYHKLYWVKVPLFE